MLLTSVHDEIELEEKRAQFGGCKLSRNKQISAQAAEGILTGLSGSVVLLLHTYMRKNALRQPLCLTAKETNDIAAASKISHREIMFMLLNAASLIAAERNESSFGSAVVEGGSGALYAGIPVSWKSKDIKFVAHGPQSAVLNAWHQGETEIRNIVTETPLCVCCRQFLREIWTWEKIEILLAESGFETLKKGSITEGKFDLRGLKLAGIKARLMNELRRNLTLGKPQDNEMTNIALNAASDSYVPYSHNYAGVAIKTKNGHVHQGRCLEIHDSIAGLLAIESGLINLILGGDTVSDVAEVHLVEKRSAVTQFSATQKLAMAMDVPFYYTITSQSQDL